MGKATSTLPLACPGVCVTEASLEAAPSTAKESAKVSAAALSPCSVTASSKVFARQRSATGSQPSVAAAIDTRRARLSLVTGSTPSSRR